MYLEKNSIKYYKIDQYENETIFIPSGWYHQVWNITDTISINHNWFNGCNVIKIWENLYKCIKKVLNEISDCRNMENFDNHSQIMLKAIFGINYEQFLNIIEYIMKKRVNSLKNNYDLILFNQYKLNHYHLIFDLKSIKSLIIKMLNDDEIIKGNTEFTTKCNYILENLNNFL